MARNNNRNMEKTVKRVPKDMGRRIKKKPCSLCRDNIEWIDYKDVPLLRKYVSDRGKIRNRRVTGNCAQHQRAISEAVKTARELILLPYTQRTVTEKPTRGGRGPRPDGERGPRGEGRGSRDDAPMAGAADEAGEDVYSVDAPDFPAAVEEVPS